MNFKKLSIVLFLIFIFSSLSLATPNLLKVHFIDVGQADCILVQTPNGKNMIVDAGTNLGPDTDPTPITSYLNSQKVTKVDILVATVPRQDHIGAMDTIITNYQIGSIFMPKKEASTKIYKVILSAIKNKNLKVNWPTAGSFFNIDPSIKVEVLAPNSSNYNTLNEYSIVLRISYGKTSFLLPGDAEKASENEMLAKGYTLKADVLKIGYHGDIKSTSPAFLKAVSPKYAVISVGKNNYYGHPNQDLVGHLQKSGITIFRTDLDGTIVASSDGQTIKFDKKTLHH